MDTINKSTSTQYISSYLSLIKRCGTNDLMEIYKYINTNEKLKPATKLSYLNSIIGLKKMNPQIINQDLSRIKALRDKLNLQIEKERANDNRNDRQKEAMETITLDKLKEFVTKLETNKSNSIKDLEHYILISMMVKFPIRNDLMEVAVVHTKADLKDRTDNFIYIPKGKDKEAVLYLKEYKTSKTHGDIIIKIDSSLTKDITKLVKSDDRKYLFVNNKNKPLSSSLFSHLMNSIFKKEFGVPISSTILRKIYLTDKYKDVTTDMKNDAKLMGHDLTTQKNVYISNT